VPAEHVPEAAYDRSVLGPTHCFAGGVEHVTPSHGPG
jgi:hypothetical protein